VLTAVRNEAALVDRFVSELHQVFSEAATLDRVHLVVVDDASTDDTVAALERAGGACPGLSLEVLRLHGNRGNQSAMAWGLRRKAAELANAHLLTLDADGEDDLTRLPELVRALDEDRSRMIFVHRDGRSDGLVIKAFYAVYRMVYRLLTGQRLIPCNMMAIPGEMVAGIAGSPLLPLHFSYPPLRLRLPHRALPLARRPRYSGRSTQNLGLLIQHGLIGLTIFYEQVVARLMLLTGGAAALAALIAVPVLIVRLLFPGVLPVGFTTIVLLSMLGFSFLALVLLVVFCMASAIFKLLIEEGRRE
jgi:glycosyltransferase involved in cell wall biosynthesis